MDTATTLSEAKMILQETPEYLETYNIAYQYNAEIVKYLISQGYDLSETYISRTLILEDVELLSVLCENEILKEQDCYEKGSNIAIGIVSAMYANDDIMRLFRKHNIITDRQMKIREKSRARELVMKSRRISSVN